MSVECFPPAEYLRDELDARGWSVETFAERSGLRRDTVDELLAGTRKITKLTALCIGRAFGVSPETWERLQAAADAAGGEK